MGPQTDKHLPQSPFTGFFLDNTFCFGGGIVQKHFAMKMQ
jgi:hypothetical protein